MCHGSRTLYLMSCNTWMLINVNIVHKTTRWLQSPREKLRCCNMFDSLRLPIGNPHFRFWDQLKSPKMYEGNTKRPMETILFLFLFFGIEDVQYQSTTTSNPVRGKGEDPGGMPYPFSATQGETTSARHTARSALQVGNSSHFGIHHGVVIW